MGEAEQMTRGSALNDDDKSHCDGGSWSVENDLVWLRWLIPVEVVSNEVTNLSTAALRKNCTGLMGVKPAIFGIMVECAAVILGDETACIGW